MADSRDTQLSLQDAVRQVRLALTQVRESTVQTDARRNTVEREVKGRESLAAELDRRIETADRAGNAGLTSELRTRRKTLDAELALLRKAYTEASVAAETAKRNLPLEEARLIRNIQDLQAQITAVFGEGAAASLAGGEAEEALSRAMGKVRILEDEAAARGEVAGGRRGDLPANKSPLSADEVAERMLADLEARVGAASTTGSVGSVAVPTRIQYLELSPNPAEDVTASISPAVRASEATPLVVAPGAVAFDETHAAHSIAFVPGIGSDAKPDSVAPGVSASDAMPVAVAPADETHAANSITDAPGVNASDAVPATVAAAVNASGAKSDSVAPGVSASGAKSVAVAPADETHAAHSITVWPDVVASDAKPLTDSPGVFVSDAVPVTVDAAVSASDAKPVAVAQGVVASDTVSLVDASAVIASEAKSVAVKAVIHLTSSQVRRGGSMPSEIEARVRIAAVGTGNIFRGAHLPAYAEIPQVQLVALCDPDKTAQDLAYRRYQLLVEAKIKQAREADDDITADRLENDLETVQLCDDISEVIETVKPDAVDICTQPFLHAPLSIQALEAGLHVMCEKPMARTWLETQRVLAAAARTGKIYQHNENWLWETEYYTARKLVASGAIGELVFMFLAQAHGGPEGSPNFWNPAFGGGGALLDNGIHAIGAAWFVSGLERTPVSVKAAEPFGMSIRMPERIIDGRYQKITVDDDAHILIRFEDASNGAWNSAHVEGSWSERDSPETEIIGTTGRIQFACRDGASVAVVTDSYGNESRRIGVSGPTWMKWPSSMYGEILNFAGCVRAGVPSISGPQFGADNSAIVGASYLSEKNNRRAVAPKEFEEYARSVAARYPSDPKAADDALVDELLAAVR